MATRTFSDTETSGPCYPVRDAYGFLLTSKAGHTLSVWGDGGIWDETSSAPVSQDSSDLVRAGSALAA